MAEITAEEVYKIGFLSRLRLTKAEVDLYQKELSSIVSYFDQIDQLHGDLGKDFRSDVLGQATTERPDQEVVPLDITTLLEGAPAVQGSSFLVPKILD